MEVSEDPVLIAVSPSEPPAGTTDLPNGLLVGPTPQGELIGDDSTWASPQVATGHAADDPAHFTPFSFMNIPIVLFADVDSSVDESGADNTGGRADNPVMKIADLLSIIGSAGGLMIARGSESEDMGSVHQTFPVDTMQELSLGQRLIGGGALAKTGKACSVIVNTLGFSDDALVHLQNVA